VAATSLVVLASVTVNSGYFHFGRIGSIVHQREHTPDEPIAQAREPTTTGLWTVVELGRRVGLSRSALHERFAELIGQAPIQYLANWRIQVGAALLRNSSSTVAMVAQEVGYESEATLTKAFKRLTGNSPALWCRRIGSRASVETIAGKNDRTAGAALAGQR
jgi:AraC-like DNA-binding protein